jgi:flavin reductase (DIM6/NTAB) family NADH-FMN oxidoreductase RutF
MAFKKIEPTEIVGNTFNMIGDNWMLVTAGDREKVNTMTAAWGGLGVMWGKDVATCYIRHQRYTFQFIEKNNYFTLSFFAPGFRKQLSYCGGVSGRDVDKVAECRFTTVFADCGAPYFKEAQLVLVCKKLYYEDINPKHFCDPQLEKHYKVHDYHRMYISEIVEVLQKIR